MSTLTWTELADGAMARGEADTYLIQVTGPEGLPVDVRLTRFQTTRYSGPGRRGREADTAEAARQAMHNTIIFALGRGPGRPAGEPEVARSVEFAKRVAEAHAAGSTWGRLGAGGPARDAVSTVLGAAGATPAARGRLAALGIAPVETGEPWRSPAEREWDASRGD